MKKSQLIVQIILRSTAAFSPSEARVVFEDIFDEHFSEWNLDTWDSEVQPHIAQTLIARVDPRNGVNVKELILDLDMLCKAEEPGT